MDEAKSDGCFCDLCGVDAAEVKGAFSLLGVVVLFFLSFLSMNERIEFLDLIPILIFIFGSDFRLTGTPIESVCKGNGNL